MREIKILSCAGELNHHAAYMCDSIYEILGDNYVRVSTEKVTDERISLGFKNDINRPYNINLDVTKVKEFTELVQEFDVIEYGSAPEPFLEIAIKKDKIVLIRLERIFKQGILKMLHPKIAIRYYKKYIKYKNCENVYFLCTSAYTAWDLKRLGINNDRVLSWAYCPEYIDYKEAEIHNHRNEKTPTILWLGRLIGWKHPEIAIEVARKLKADGMNFKLKIAGTGILNNTLKKAIQKYNLVNEVDLIGSIPAGDVRDYMRKSDILLATSDFNEGWGVIINEAMNSGCAIVASHSMGAVPFLIKHGHNGLIYENGNTEEAYLLVKNLIINRENALMMGKNANETIKKYYSPKVYADKLIHLCREINHGRHPIIDNGIGSKAKIIKNNDFKKIVECIIK